MILVPQMSPTLTDLLHPPRGRSRSANELDQDSLTIFIARWASNRGFRTLE